MATHPHADRSAQRRAGGLADRLGRWLARRLAARHPRPSTAGPTDLAALARALRPGDVLLVEGDTRFATAIKYLTQSTWSHAALFVGAEAGLHAPGGAPLTVVEADVVDGVRAVPLESFAGLHLRLCRPVGLRPAEIAAVVDHAVARLGHRYDLRNVVDLLRYLLPTPPVPTRWRRRLLAFVSGAPTRAICSTMIAQTFQSVRYPILPRIESLPAPTSDCGDCTREILHVRHHSLFVPRDFDLSPYFRIVKPPLDDGFDPHALAWATPGDEADDGRAAAPAG
jgi:hypothetical protein